MSEHQIRTNILLEEIVDLLEANLKVSRVSMGYLAKIAHRHHKPVTSFNITRSDPMNPIVPGSTAVYTATPVPTGATLVAPFPTWTSSDTANAPITVDATGLVATVTVPTGIVVPVGGLPFTLSINYTNADGTVATGSITDTINAPVVPPVDVVSFTIARTA